MMPTLALPGLARPASVLCLGTGGYGSAIPRDASFALLDAFAAVGGTFLDTAHVYAAWLPGGEGASERTIGAWVKSRGMRDRMVIATKGAHPLLPPGSPSRLRPEDIARDLDESRERLGVEHVDLYWLHRDDPAVPVGEILDALARHHRTGAIGAIGASNWTTARLDAAAAHAARAGVPGFVASQIGWSLARAIPERIPPGGMLFMDEATEGWHRRSGLRVIPYSAQANGYFAKGAPPALYDSVANRERRLRVERLARERGASPNAVALAWLLKHPSAGSAIIGPRTREQLDDSVCALAVPLSARETAWLDLAPEA
jgi:aryl-alcohol dehydrogenase-like predicted oxidoreductase